MRDDDLYETIRARGDLDSTAAAREAAQATMRTLGERIAHGEAEALADAVPDDLAGAVTSLGGEAQAFEPDAFVSRVADREEKGDASGAERHVQATFETVGSRVNRREWRDVRAQLPESYAPLYEVSAVQ